MGKFRVGLGLAMAALVVVIAFTSPGSGRVLTERQMGEIRGRLPIGCPCNGLGAPISCGDWVRCNTCTHSTISPPPDCPATDVTFTDETYRQCTAKEGSALSCGLSKYVLCWSVYECCTAQVYNNRLCWASQCVPNEGWFCRLCTSGDMVPDSEHYAMDQVCN